MRRGTKIAGGERVHRRGEVAHIHDDEHAEIGDVVVTECDTVIVNTEAVEGDVICPYCVARRLERLSFEAHDMGVTVHLLVQSVENLMQTIEVMQDGVRSIFEGSKSRFELIMAYIEELKKR